MAYEIEAEEYDDVVAACKQLADEIQGMKEYRYMAGHATCTDLKLLAEKHLASEKEHAQGLAQWIHAYIGRTVG